MQHFPKERVVLVLIVPSLILFVFMLLVTTNTITNVSGVETEGVGVYWDSNCTDGVSSIDWKTLTPGSVKNIAVYIQNEDEEPIWLIMSTTNWNPSKASDYITLEWNYDGRQIDPSQALQITLTLSISRYIEGISSFSFDIVVTGSDSLLGDVDGDGRITYADVYVVLRVYSGTWPYPAPGADLNGDGRITYADVYVALCVYSGTWPF